MTTVGFLLVGSSAQIWSPRSAMDGSDGCTVLTGQMSVTAAGATWQQVALRHRRQKPLQCLSPVRMKQQGFHNFAMYCKGGPLCARLEERRARRAARRNARKLERRRARERCEHEF